WVERERDMWRNSYGIAAVRLEQARERAEAAERERDEWRERADHLRDERDEWESLYFKAAFRGTTPIARAEAAEARLADPYSQANQDAAAWNRVAAHPALRMDLLPEADHTYAGGVFERIPWLAETAEAAEARTAPAVTREDVDACVYGSRRAGRECDEQGFVPVHVQEAVDQLCD